MNPSLILEFSCIEEMVVITQRIREVYRDILDLPEAQGNDQAAIDFRKNCVLMMNQMHFLHLQAKGCMNFNTPDFSEHHC